MLNILINILWIYFCTCCLNETMLLFNSAPKVAKLAYKIVKPFVSEKTLKNVKLFPKCNLKVKKFLLQHIDADELPQKFGGNKKIGGVSFLICKMHAFSSFKLINSI